MESVNESTSEPARSPAGIAFMEAIELGVDERSPYPDGAEFIDSEQPWAGKAISEAAAEGRAVVLCTPDGRRLVVQPARTAA
jgi:hypothetical protein